MSLDDHIQKWVSIDNQLRLANERVRDLRDKRTKITNDIIEKNNIINNKIPVSDGHLKIVTINTSEPLTFTYLEKSLKEIIKNENQVKLILDHIRNRRSIKSNIEIKRSIN